MAGNQQIIDQIATTLQKAGLAGESGTLFYSGCEALKKGDVYFLGANPGGDPGKITTTIVDRLHERKDSPHNAYLDEAWRHPTPGQSLLQRRIQYLFQQLGLNLRETCASNLVFARSTVVEKLHLDWGRTANLCWPVHQLILAHVRPRMVLAYGNEARDYIKGKMRVEEEDWFEVRSAREVKWFGCARGSLALGGGEVLEPLSLLSVPHLSRFKIDARLDWGNKFDTREALEWLRGRKEEALG